MDIIILEDELLIAEHLKDLIESFGHKVLVIAQTKNEFFNAIETSLPDLVFLDINIKGKYLGLEIAEEIKEKHHLQHLFITSFRDKKLIDEALRSDPVTYIVKPFREAEIFTAIRLAAERKRTMEEKPFIMLKSNHLMQKVYTDEILFVKSDNVYIGVYTKKGLFTKRSSLSDFINSHDFEDLRQVHRSYVVNLQHIQAIKANKLIIEGHEVPVSRKYAKLIKQEFTLK
jgi:DNA-binding LytR/AlgR family response regulator